MNRSHTIGRIRRLTILHDESINELQMFDVDFIQCLQELTLRINWLSWHDFDNVFGIIDITKVCFHIHYIAFFFDFF